MLVRCGVCGEEKDSSAFHRAKKSKSGFQHKCKQCDKARFAKRYSENRESILRRTAEYAKANPHVPRASTRRYNERNHEKVKARGRAQRYLKPEIFKIRDARYGKRYPEKVAAKTARRRAQKLLATPIWADLKTIQFFYTCAALMTTHTGREHHVDHIVPLRSKIVCGLHCPANLQILLGAENSSKGSRYWPDMPDFF